MLVSSPNNTFSLAHMRWLILLSFPIAALFAQPITGGFETPLYLSAAMGACAWLLYKLDSLRPDMLAIWMVVIIFLATYFLRYPVLLFDPSFVVMTHPGAARTVFRNEQMGLVNALKLTSFVFVVFCIVAGSILRRERAKPNTACQFPAELNRQISVWLFIFVALLLVVLGYVSYVYKIGKMGSAPGEPLPYRLKGIVFYARHVFIPLLILALACNATFVRNHRMLYASLILLAIHGVSDALLRGSKSSLLLCLLLAVFLAVSGGLKIRYKGMLLLCGLVLLAILLIPTINMYRSLRNESVDGMWELFYSALTTANHDLFSVIKTSFILVYFRIPGIETTWAITSLVSEPLDDRLFNIIRSPFGVTGYLSFDIYQVPMNDYTLFAPGFVGWLYLAWGWISLTLGGALLAILCVNLPRVIYGGYLRWAPLANTFFLWVLFISLTDGTLDSNFLLIAAGIASLIVLEFFGRTMKIGKYV
jgi:hypothetical protein